MHLSISVNGHRLDIETLPADARLTLTTPGMTPQTWLLSRLFPASFTRPWDLRPQRFTQVSARQTNQAVEIIAVSDRVETTAAFTFRGARLHVAATWRAVGTETLTDAAFALTVPLKHDAASERITLPHVLYNGNPSAAPERFIPRFTQRAGDMLICELTRFPVPVAQVEWLEKERAVYVSLFALPGDDPDGVSLGVMREADGLTLAAATGIVALNGRKDEIYGVQRQAVAMQAGYMMLTPGQTVRREFMIDAGPAERTGWGFRRIVSAGYELLSPRNKPIHAIDRIIDLKVNALNQRWHDDGEVRGYICARPDAIYKRPPYFLYGWTGQSLKLAWCSAFYGDKYGRPEMIDRARKVTDFFVAGGGTGVPGLRFNYYFLKDRQWTGPRGMGEFPGEPVEDGMYVTSRATGEALANLGKVIRLFRDLKLDVPAAWVRALRETADFLLQPMTLLPSGIWPRLWRTNGRPLDPADTGAGISCISVLLEAFAVTDERRYLNAARDMLERYWKQCGDRFDRPFNGATLDAYCEDKECGLLYFLAAEQYERLTGDAEVKQWTLATADWILTFVYMWHTGFRPGTICERKGFNTIGWPGVSVQNHHLDVFFPAYEMYDFGRRHGLAMYERFGRLVFDAWSHGLCTEPGEWGLTVPGEQAEMFFHTNYIQGTDDRTLWRGGSNPWNPAWIIALVLEAALHFRHDGPR